MKKIYLALFLMVTFSGLHAQGFLNVVAPNGGEMWITGCPAIIQWTSSNAGGAVKIELYKNDVFYLVICPQAPAATTSFTWMVPASVAPASTYKVKVTSLANPAMFDFSNNPFTISRGSIHVISPNGGETWVKGTMHPITWQDNLCGNVRIELWKGNAMHSLIAASVPSTGSFNWTIPNTSNLPAGNDYRVKVADLAGSNTTTSLVWDFSDSLFSILPASNTGQITVVAPNGGENLIMGCQTQIQWLSTTSATSLVKIELFKNEVFLLTICPQAPAGATNFNWFPSWTLPQGNDYKIKISTLTSPVLFDFSNANFSINKGNITVTSPNGGETWVKGTMHPILWNDNLCDNVRIELWKAGVYHSTIAQSVPSNGTFNWTVPNVNSLVPGNDYQVKILSMANATSTTSIVWDFSDSLFSIVQGAPPAPITVIAPNGGETWITGCPNQIQWAVAAASTGMVKIELYKNNTFQMVIAPQVPAAMGTFTWVVPWNVIPANDYKVKISSLTSATAFDFSNGPFSIIRGMLTVVSPNGGETWQKGTMHPIFWTDNLCDNVRIELWKGTTFNAVIAQSVPSNGVFNWMIPVNNNLIPGNDYKIKIISAAPVSANTALVFDFSDNFFSITAAGINGPEKGDLVADKIYPNPCTDQLNLQFNQGFEQPVTIRVYDRMGIVVKELNIDRIPSNEPVTIDVHGLSTGTYLYVVSGEGISTIRGRFLIGD